ncbi:hypothetical protein C5E44_26010 [Nocardia nova]|nr:hypothetical protein C5E44_26010 [Nocardia nova]
MQRAPHERPSESKPTHTLDSLLDAAADLAASHGPAAVTMSAVAAEAVDRIVREALGETGDVTAYFEHRS